MDNNMHNDLLGDCSFGDTDIYIWKEGSINPTYPGLTMEISGNGISVSLLCTKKDLTELMNTLQKVLND